MPYEKVGNNEPVCIADEVPFDIPDSWEWVRLNFVCQLTDGIKIENRLLHNLDAKYLRGKSEGKTIEFGKYVEKGTYLILVDGENSGEVFIAPENGYMGSTFKVLWMSSNIYREYLLQFLDFHRTELKNSKKGAAIPHLNKNLFFNLLLPMPPYYEQKRILEKLKELHPFVDKYRKSDEKITKVIDDFPDLLKKSILQEAVQGKLVPQDENDEPASVLLERIRAEKQKLVAEGKIKKDKHESVIFRRDNSHYEKLDGIERCIDDEIPFDIPNNWRWVRLGEIYQHNTGKALNSSNKDGTPLTYITTSNLYWNKFELGNLKKMLFTENEVEKCTVKTGDLLVCEGGDIGRTAIWTYEFPMRIQNHIHRLRPYINIHVKFYYFVLYLYKKSGILSGKGIGIQGLSSKALHNILVPLPPLSEQHRIVEKIEQLLNVTNKL